MAKKADKALKNLQKDVFKLRKQNDKLAKALEETREDQAEALREIWDLLQEHLTTQEAGPVDSSQKTTRPTVREKRDRRLRRPQSGGRRNSAWTRRA